MSLTLRIKQGNRLYTVGSRLILTTGTSRTTISGNIEKNSIQVSDNRQTYSEWYSSQVQAKRVGMSAGGVSNGTAGSGEQPSFSYNFSKGIRVYTHTRVFGQPSETPYLKSMQGNAVGSTGNIQILSGKTVDVGVVSVGGQNKIQITKLNTGIITNPGPVYREINSFLWYLYHALNVQIYRMRIFDPQKSGTDYGEQKAPVFKNSHWMGTISEYQALVSRWNWLAWKRSFLAKVEESGETLNFSIGYFGVSCDPVDVFMTFELTLIGDMHEFEDTIKFFTVYMQGVSTGIDPAPKISIMKYNDPDNTSTLVQGHGSDDMVDNEIVWNRIVVEIGKEEGSLKLKQGEQYNAAFSIAVALNEQIAYFYQNIGSDSFKFSTKARWTIGGRSYTQDLGTASLRTIILHSEEPTDEVDIEYNVK